jgi:hypothetical protein
MIPIRFMTAIIFPFTIQSINNIVIVLPLVGYPFSSVHLQMERPKIWFAPRRARPEGAAVSSHLRPTISRANSFTGAYADISKPGSSTSELPL